MRKLVPFFAAALVSCASPTSPDPSAFVGVITAFRSGTAVPTMLVRNGPLGEPDSQCERSAYYTVWSNTEIYRLGGGRLGPDALLVGTTVSVEWDGFQLDSCPPVRRARRIFVHLEAA